MCGVAGIFAYSAGAPPVAEAELTSIRDAMAARGPDGKGAWLSPDGRVGLGHRRLAIIDLDDRALQPMASAEGRHVIAFNGEIYNYRALGAELQARGCTFRTESDTEVLLVAYACFGDAMFGKLRGMYAFALWDEDKRALLVARDPYGIKPLYLADDGKSVRFASQVKALLKGGVARDPDTAAIAGFYLLGSVPEPRTRYRAIRALPAGSYQWFDAEGPRPTVRHFDLPRIFRDAAAGPPPDRVALAADVSAALRDSVRHHQVADVPVGAFLSAGIDSSALVGLMSEAGSRQVRAITLLFEQTRGTEYDESALAARVAERFGAAHTTCVLTASDLRAAGPALLAAMDQPSIDGLNTFLVSRAARQAGLKVAVSGLGSDELFGGYSTFTAVPRWVAAMSPASHLTALARAVERAFPARLAQRLHVSPKLGSMLRYGGSYEGAYLLRRGVFMPADLPALMGDLAEDGLRELDPLGHIAAALQPCPEGGYAKVALLEASFYLRNQLLRDADWASMAHGLEVRVPFVDAALLQRLAPLLLPHAKNGGTRQKALIAGAPRVALPGEVVSRKKTGFFVPIEPLLEDEHSGLSAWKRVPMLARRGCHWARRLSYALIEAT